MPDESILKIISGAHITDTQRRAKSIMLRLKNIKINENLAKADFCPEDSRSWGHIVVDVGKGETVFCREVPGYGASYKGHAKRRLLAMAKENDRREECIVMWY